MTLPSYWTRFLNSIFGIKSRYPANHDHPAQHVAILVIVEGIHDMQFLRRISRMLHVHNSERPDLGAWEQAGKLIFIPFGGSEAAVWSLRLAPLRLPEFHLFDRETQPLSEERRRAAEIVNCRQHCRAAITTKRSLENYLHPDCLREVRGLALEIDDEACVAELVAQRLYASGENANAWASVPYRSRRKLKERAKHWLNTAAVDRMTVERLRERDPKGEVQSWLRTIARLAAAEG